MKPIRKKIFFFFTFVLIELLVWYKQNLVIIPDFGIYMTMGKYILESGLPKIDPFSYTMPSYPYIDHEWLSHIAIYQLYGLIGMSGIALISTLLIVLSLLIVTPKTIKPFSFILILLVSGGLLPFANTRPQDITWLFSAVLLYVGSSNELWKKTRYFIPLLIALWTNLHGGFAAGLLILMLISVVQSWRFPKESWTNLTIFSLSAIATLINPYGLRIWQEVIATTTDSYLRTTISEWEPTIVGFTLTGRLCLSLYFLITFPLVMRYLFKLNFIESSIYLIWLVLALISKRHIPYWLILSLPASYHSLELLSQESWFKQKVYKYLNINSLIWGGLIIICSSAFFYQAMLSIQGSYSSMEAFTYPVNAIKFLDKYPHQGNILSQYDWGGYLLWKMPDQKVFIDGRMPSWRWQSPNSAESNWAFKEYKESTSGYTDFNSIFEKYNVTTILWPTSYFQRNSGATLSKFSISSKNSPVDAMTIRLINEGWKRVYADPVALIYVKPKN